MAGGWLVTYGELEASDRGAGFVEEAIRRHCAGRMWRDAMDADQYMAQRNPTVSWFTRLLYTVDGREFSDPTASNMRICSNLFRRLNVQRAAYSLGNGVSFAAAEGSGGEDETKAALGPRFDDDLMNLGLKALVHGVSFAFWNLDHVDVFELTGFVPVWDEHSGALRAGVRFWRLDPHHPMHATLYEEDGYADYVGESDGKGGRSWRREGEKQGYQVTYHEVPADGMALAVDQRGYSRLPIVPFWGSDAKQSTLVGLRAHVDAYDLIKSGLANDVLDCAEVYWIISGAGGMRDKDVSEYRDRLRLLHVATVTNADETSITPYTQEIPYQARKETLAQIRSDMYEDFGALDVHTVSAGATNDHIDAAYQPMDEEADEFERHMREGIMDLLTLLGIEDVPVFSRNRVSNVKEQVETVMLEAAYLDEETVLRKLPNVTPDEVAAILARKDAEAADRLAVPAVGDEGAE